eukprot:COSAG03_NODE_14698_length_455_cov_0.946629_1_plen_30_part_10
MSFICKPVQLNPIRKDRQRERKRERERERE